MNHLLFCNPVFRSGLNVSVRRGTKWAGRERADISGHGVVNLRTKILRFMDIEESDIEFEHDPACSTLDGLFDEMRTVYGPDFDSREIITLVYFEIEKGQDEHGN